MSLKTTNASTLSTAVNLRASIARVLEEIIVLLQINTKESLTKGSKKLTLLFKMIEVFKEDEKENLFSSDKVALEILNSQALELVKTLEEKSSKERLDAAMALKRTARATLG